MDSICQQIMARTKHRFYVICGKFLRIDWWFDLENIIKAGKVHIIIVRTGLGVAEFSKIAD